MQSLTTRKAAFSLIELLIVLSLCMIIATLFSVNLSFFERLLVHVEADKLLVTCRRLQYQACATQQPQQIQFDVPHNRYTYETTTEHLNRSVSFGTLHEVKGPPSKPSSVITNPVTFVQNRIVFTPDGIIQPGSVYLISNDKQVMYALCSPVSKVSFLRLYRYDGSWHCLM
jgi:type II secretory pathway pseudopilin PulG